MKLTDISLMPSGKYKGTRLIDVPCEHLLKLYNTTYISKDLRAYIEDNMEALLIESERNMVPDDEIFM